MTTARRVAAIEASMDPREIAFHVIAEAHQFATLDDYARSLVEVPIEATPMSRIGAQTEASVRSSMRGQPREMVDAAVRRSVGDAIFRFILFLKLNTAALEMAEHEGLRAAAVFYWMGCLLGGPRKSDLEPAEWVAHEAEQAECWRLWRAVVASLLVLSLVEEEAREELAKRYLGGQTALLSGVQEDWDRFGEQVDRLWSLAEGMAAGTPGAEDKRIVEPEEAVWEERVSARARHLADDARITTFDRLGENHSAVRILEGRLG